MIPAFGFNQVRSTPLRLTFLLLTIFAMAALACLAVAFEVTRTSIDAALAAELQQTINEYRGIQDGDDLRERLAEAAAKTDPDIRILFYVPDQGTAVSNVASFPPVSGVTIVADNSIRAKSGSVSDSYLALSARVGAGHLIVAQSREQVEEMGEIFLAVLFIGLLPALVIAGLAGLWVAKGARIKIDAIQHTLLELKSGTLSARLEGVEGRSDDLSGIGQEVNRMARAQEALVASIRQVSSDIAHDLKTPIQRVAVVLEQVMNKTTLTEGQEVLLSRAIGETERIVQTFQSLLQLAQIEGGAVRDRLHPVNLVEVSRDVVDFLEVEAEERGFALSLRVQPNVVACIKGDRHLLSQLIGNLVQNALTHVPKGGPVVVEVTGRGNETVLTVSDHGPGIPEKERGKVLQRLYRLDQSRTTEGNGLGLSLVSAISDLHGARLTLEDNMPGLRVRIIFPAVDPA
ncbi:MAG TPA: HAMP domain-containing histidine kinase [Roseobacter sp.]|uniref:histidine kinase n=1 Tax=marine sediment metagenome TaxID=412755 RepID=A0A0F9RWE0_9ZZZZ|nr:HAMP domain-containing histidine kinase [Roseobacter sp.]HEC70442.1 HAMP domain-containing histidine kinase [Roseobacter sp.]